MIRYFLILFFILNSSCSKQEEAPFFELSLEPTFVLYVSRFIEYSNKFNIGINTNNLIIRIDYSMTGPTVSGQQWILALCSKSGGYSEILVNPFFWNNKNYPDSDREELIFHELGHCVLNRIHDSRTVKSLDSPTQIPISIMNPYHLGRILYESNYNYYMKELFFQSVDPMLSISNPSQFDPVYYKEIPLIKTKTAANGHFDETGFFVIDGISCGDE